MAKIKTLGKSTDIETINKEFDEIGELLEHEDTVMSVTYIKKEGFTLKDKIVHENPTLKKKLEKQKSWAKKEVEGKLVGWNNQGETVTLTEGD